MTELTIEMPPGLRSWVEARLAEGGYVDAADYVRDLVRRDQARSEASTLDDDDEMRALVEEGLASGVSDEEPDAVLRRVSAGLSRRVTELRLSRRAEREEIGAWGAQAFGRAATASHIAGFGRLFAILRDLPYAGEARPQWGHGIRTLTHRPHRLLYRVDEDGVLIVRILHMSRDVRRAMRSRP